MVHLGYDRFLGRSYNKLKPRYGSFKILNKIHDNDEVIDENMDISITFNMNDIYGYFAWAHCMIMSFLGLDIIFFKLITGTINHLGTSDVLYQIFYTGHGYIYKLIRVFFLTGNLNRK